MKKDIKTRKKNGFTLIELLVVIAIIGVLTTLGMISINTARQKSRDSKRWTEIRALQSALEICINEGGSPPDVTTATDWNDVLNMTCASGNPLGAYLVSNVMPMPPQSSTCQDAPSGDCYMYCATGAHYVLYSKYEGNPPAGGLNGAISNYAANTECILSNGQRPLALPVCSPVVAGSFCLGNL